MDDCIKSIENCVDLPDFLTKLETLSTYTDSNKVEVDKAESKLIMTTFMRFWKFAAKEKEDLLECYFSLLASVEFFAPIAKPFLKLISTHTGKRSAKWVYTLLRMCCIVFSVKVPELETEVIDTEIRLIQEIAESSTRLADLAVHYMITMQNFSTKEESEVFVDKVIAICVSNRDSLLLTGCHFYKSKFCKKNDATLSTLVKAFLAILSSSRTAPSKSLLNAEGELISLCSHDILSKDLFPAISRAVKRNSDLAVPYMIKAIQSLHVDSSRYLTYIIDTFMYYVKKENNENLPQAQTFIKQAIKQASDPELIFTLIQSIMKENDAIRPTPTIKKQVYMGIAWIIENMNEKVISKQDLLQFGNQALTLILPLFTKETNSTVKTSLLVLLSDIVATTNVVTDEMKTMIYTGLKTTGTLFSYYLYVLYKLACIKCELNTKEILPILEDCIKKAIAKPFASGRDAIIALPSYILLSIQSGYDYSSLLTQVFAEGSFLYIRSLLTTTNKEEETLLSFCNECIMNLLHVIMITHCIEETQQNYFCQYYYSLLDTSSITVKQQGYSILRQLVQTRISFEQLLNSFYHWLITSSSILFYNDEYPIAHDTLLNLLSIFQHGALTEEDICILAWCSSHPFVVNEHHPSLVWKKIASSFQAIQNTDSFITSFNEILHTPELAITSKNNVLAHCTQQMIINLCSCNEYCELVYSAVIDECIENAQSTGVNDISSKDLCIWQTPANVEWKPRQEDMGYVPEVTTSVKKQRNKKGSNPFGKNDDAWVEEYKAEMNKEQIAKEAAEKAIAARCKALEEQAIIREKVDQIALPYRNALILLDCMIKGSKDQFYHHLPQCLQLIYSLLSNPLVCDLARLVFTHCTNCIQDPILASVLSNTLYQIFYKGFSSKSLTELISSSFNITIDVWENYEFLSCYLPYFLPILKAITFDENCKVYYPTVATILNQFSTCNDNMMEDIIRYFRYDVCEILLELLRVAPRVDPSPESILMNFCDASPSLQQREIFLLLGDRGLLNDSEDVRMNSLLNLDGIEKAASNPLYVIRLYMTQYDDDEEIAEEAKQQWEEKELSINATFYLPLFQLLGHSVEKIRHSASRAIAQGLLLYPTAVKNVLDKIEMKYKEIDEIEDKNEKKGFTMLIRSLFETLKQCASIHVFAVSELMSVLNILFTCGFVNEDDNVRIDAMKAGEVLIEAYGEESSQELLKYLNTTLTSLEKDANTEEETLIQDHQREGCVVLLGKATCFLNDGDKRIFTTLDILIKSLSIPSASVQEAVSRCLTPLFKYECLRAEAKTYVEALLHQLTEGATFAERHGAAVGLAGIMKGIGSKAFKEFNINDFIEKAAQSESMSAREGSMLVLEALFDSLTFMFEPYVVKFLPLLLENFSSKDEGVRLAAQGASRSVMRNLSPHGVKLIMPKVLEGLNDHRWRTKVVAIQMLGSMAYCSPQSLSACLPRIVPILTESCNDAHSAIQDAAKAALIDIGNVIRTPEIADLQQTLIRALTEPHLYVANALKALTETSFQHTMDAPSLSLIIPILMRGLNERATDTKKKAALIVGNICSLANRDDVLPYLPKLLPPLKKCLMDPLPDVRAVAAHSIGMLGREVGEEEMKSVLEWLIEKVYEDSTVAERSGAAQGLADLLASSSKKTFDSILNELLQNSTHPRACVREGVMWTISFLPSTLGDDFASLVPSILPAIVSGLADESEMVAEVALRAGQVLVKTYAKSQLNMVLPPIKEAMMDDDWRIRQSSIMLMGELLYTLGKTKAVGISEDENDTGLSNDTVELLLQQELGMDTWIEVMSSLFFLTTDVTAAVRQSAFQVWKSVVNNTPRTLKKILGALTKLCFDMFTSDSENKRTLAARCLGEIVQKLGEFVIPHVLDVLNNGLQNDDPIIRQVVCIGFVQVLSNCSSSVLKTWGEQFLASLKTSICDDDEHVREAAAEALTLLQRKGNSSVFDQILPILLADLEGESERQHRALNGLKQIIVLQGKQVIQTLFFKLTMEPLSATHLHVLNCIIPSTVKYLHFFVNEYMATFFQTLYGKIDEVETPMEDQELAQAIHETLRCMVINIQTYGAQWTVTCLDKLSGAANNGYRREACKLIGDFCSDGCADYDEQMQMILRLIIKRAADNDTTVIEAAWNSLALLIQHQKVEKMLNYVAFMSNMIATVISTERYKPGVDMNTYVLPAFTLKDGLKPLFQLLQKGVMVASTERKADCASLICDLVQYAPAENVRVYALQVTGPLIRIVGDKYSSEVRVTIFRALNLLLGKSGDALRPFLPQLQTTFIRALKDSNKGVREQGSEALVHIIKLSTRIDNVINDLSSDILNNDIEIRESIMVSLQNIMLAVGMKVQPQTRKNVESRMIELLYNEAADIRSLAANVLGVCLSFSDDSTFNTIVTSTILSTDVSSIHNADERHGRCLAIGQLIKYNNERSMSYHDHIIHDVTAYLKDDVLLIRKTAISVSKYILNIYNTMNDDNKKLVIDELIKELTSCVTDQNSSVRYETVISISLFGKVCKDTNIDLLSCLVPSLLKSVQDSYIPVKISAERALIHLLHIHDDPSVLENYLQSISVQDARYLKTYVQRVLVKLPKNVDEDLGSF